MAGKINIIVYPAKDVAKSKDFFSTYLGIKPYVESPYYVGYRIGGLEVGLDPSGKTIVAYTEVEDIEASLKTLSSAGATVTMQPKDVGSGLLVAQVEVDGNTVGLRQQPK